MEGFNAWGKSLQTLTKMAQNKTMKIDESIQTKKNSSCKVGFKEVGFHHHVSSQVLKVETCWFCKDRATVDNWWNRTLGTFVSSLREDLQPIRFSRDFYLTWIEKPTAAWCRHSETSVFSVENAWFLVGEAPMAIIIWDIPGARYAQKYSDLPGAINWKRQWVRALEAGFGRDNEVRCVCVCVCLVFFVQTGKMYLLVVQPKEKYGA